MGNRVPKTHYLKTWPEYFIEVWLGNKNFEFRKNDRDFQVGDTLVLQEYDPEKQQHSGRHITVKVTYVLQDFEGIAPGYCVMSIKQ